MHGQGRPNWLPGLWALRSRGERTRRAGRYVAHCLLVAFVWFATCNSLTTFTSAQLPALPFSFKSDGRSEPRGPIQLTAATTEVADSQHSMRLRVTWGGGEEKTWRAAIQIDRGEILNPMALGLSFDTPGSVFIHQNQLQAISPSPNHYGGIDFDVRAPLDSRLSIELYPEENREQRFLRTVTLRSLISEPVQVELDQQQNQFQWQRAPGDELQVEFDRPHLVFAPGDALPIVVKPNLTLHVSKAMRCRGKIVTARNNSIVVPERSWDLVMDENGSAPLVPMEWQVPMEEGVYDLVFELEPKWFQTGFQQTRTSRRVQFIVIDSQTPLTPTNRDWKLVQQIDPAQFPRPDRPASRPLWSQPQWLDRPAAPFKTIDVAGQSMIQLEPNDWHAIPIAIKQVGHPYQIEIEFGAESSLALGISLLQPDVLGNIPTFGVDSGVSIDPLSKLSRAVTVGKVLKHRLTVWPRHHQPYLLLANRHNQQSVQIGRINVYQTTKSDGNLSEVRPSDPPPKSKRPASVKGQRRFMALYELPLFADHFGAEKMIDQELEQPLDDWVTFYQGGQRLIEYLQTHQYDGVVLAATSDGSSLFPSARLQPTPRWDNGIFFATGQDPIRKDVLEMLMRLFDRANLELVPALTFSGPIPELEISAHRQEQSAPYLRDYRQQMAPRSLELPWYDPLAPRTQTEIRAVVDELVERYRQHSSFGGVGLIGRGDTSIVLSGRRWGFEPEVMRQFLNAHQLPIPQSDVAGNLDWQPTIQSVLLGSHRQEWANWRSQQLTDFLTQLADSLQRTDLQLPLVIASIDLLRTSELDTLLAPSLHWPPNPETLWNEVGWNSDLWQHPQLVLLNGHRISPTESIAQRRTELAWNQANDSRETAAWSTGAELFIHRPEWAHFQALESANLFGGQSMPLWRLQPLAPLGQLNRQRFAEKLWSRDTRLFVDGGWLPPSGQEESLVDFWKVFKQLPNLEFTAISHPLGRKAPIAVRQLEADGQRFGYVVNRSPWPTQIELQLSAPEWTRIQSLHASTPIKPGRTANSILLTIEPFGLWGWQAPATAPYVTSWTFETDAQAVEVLRKNLLRLQTKLFQSNRPLPLPGLVDSDFQSSDPLEKSWTFDAALANQIQRLSESPSRTDASTPSHNLSSTEQVLRMTSAGEVLWIRSQPLAVPETGRLSISVWLRTEQPEQPPPLRIAVESDADQSRHYYRFGTVGGLAPQDAASQIESQWKQFVVHFDDLPLQGIDRVRIGFDLMGAGQVDFDRIEVFDRWLDSNDTKALAQLLATSAACLESSQTYEQSRRLLESYWPQFVDRWISNNAKPANSNTEPTNSGSPSDVIAEDSRQEKNNVFRRLRRATQPRLFPFR